MNSLAAGNIYSETINTHNTPLLSNTPAFYKIFAYFIKIYKFRAKQAFLYCLRSAFSPKETIEWLNYIDNNPILWPHENIRADLASKIYRPYLRTSYTIGKRISLLTSHFDIVIRQFPNAVLQAILEGKETELVRLRSGKSDVSYVITTFRDRKYGKEGELSLGIKESFSGTPLATVSFVFSYDQNKGIIAIIGGLQGPAPETITPQENKQNIIRATKGLNGLMPKRAVMEALCSVAKTMGVTAIYAPSHATHVVRKLSGKKQKIYSSYEEFWQELGGIKTSDEDYVIATDLPKRSLEEVPAKKRKDWLIRRKHLETISASITQALS